MTKSILILAFSFLHLVTFALDSEDLGTLEDTSSFFSEIQGRYQILIAADQVPKEDNKWGYVSVEEEEGLMVLPYCHKTGNVCDPGFRSFPLEETVLYKKVFEPGYEKYTLLLTESDKTYRYTWEVRNRIVHFLDTQYTLVSGEVFPLEFIMEKAPEPPQPVQP